MARKVSVPFGERLRVSYRIMRQTFATLRDHRDLYPLVLMAALVMVVGMGAVMAVTFVGAMDADASGPTSPALLDQLPTMALFMALFLPIMVLAGRYQLAFAYALFQRLEGNQCSRGDALGRANGMMFTYVRWTLISGVVGFVISSLGMVAEKFRWLPGLGRFIQIIGVFGWAAASFFVIPVMVVEGERRATEALRRSIDIARRQWGKSVAGIVTVGLVVMVPTMVVAVLLMLVMMSFVFGTIGSGADPASFQAFFVLWMGALFLLIGIGMVLSMFLNGAYQVILYGYDRTGKILGAFGPETVVEPWKRYQTQ